jgi:hypothetical protein
MALFVDVLGGLVGTFFIISVLSMLWKDNPIFRIGQQAIIGATMAHYILLNFKSALNNAVLPMLGGNLLLFVPLLLGVLMYTRLKNEIAWVARYPTGVLVGVGTGVMIAGTLRGQIIDQIKNTVLDLTNSAVSGNMTGIINTLLIAIGVVTAISFFTFTREHKGVLGISAKIGRIFLMISLGANWSGELVWYLTQLIGRLSWIINTVIKVMLLGG